MKALFRDKYFYILCLCLLICLGWHVYLLQAPSDTLTGNADFHESQYHLNLFAFPDSKWSTNGISNYHSILRADARDVSEWLASIIISEQDAGKSWQLGDSHQYLVQRRDDNGKRVINVTLQSIELRDLLNYSGLAIVAVICNVALALAVASQNPRPPIATPLMLMACASLLNLAWISFGVPFSYIALKQAFFMQLILHTLANILTVGIVVHIALTFPTPLSIYIHHRKLLLVLLYALYPIGLVFISVGQSNLVDKFVSSFDWELQISIVLKAIAYLIWARQYRQASIANRAQLHWIFVGITLYDLLSLAQIFSQNNNFGQIQLGSSLLIPLGYALAILPRPSLRITLGSTSGFIHGVANTLTLALFLSGLGLVANLLLDSNHTSDLPLITVFLAGIFALTTVPLANLLREQFDSWFQGTRSAQRALLYQFTARVSEHITLNELTQAFYDVLEQGVQPNEACLWLWNDEAHGLQRIGISTSFVAVDDRLYEQLLMLQAFTPVIQINHWQDVQSYHGLIALITSGRLVGICAIGSRADGRNYSDDTLRFFEALTRSATLALRNAQLVKQMEEKIIALQYAYHQFMNAQENERQRLASELHDETLQQLAHVNLVAGSLYSHVDAKGTSAVKELQSILVLTERHLREILRGVHPSVLTDLGLIPAIRSWLPHPEGIAIGMTAIGFDGKRLPDPALEMTLYRLCQESLNNAIKHAHATQINVKFTWNDSSVILEVIDNGMGFDPSALTSKYQAQNGHFGLMNLHERVNALNGKLVIKSLWGLGTNICAILPLQNEIPSIIGSRDGYNGVR